MVSRVVMAVLFIGAGVTHFVRPGLYAKIVPPWFPSPMFAVYASGIAEIALGVGLLFARTARLSSWGLVALLVAVFPANVYHWTADVRFGGEPLPGWYHAVRLPLQAVLIAWAVVNALKSP